ncbi:DNA polymerase III subunit delta' [Tepidiphilus margaritifer]|uniref:DNA polymerase III subunit delta' n=1 Tax=Tepidiphilus margaritifer TaxID=203471 RepID=UPI0003FD1AE0|nr:DNA polymerase III subunit delta' [Tepidiphilus margaritifer]
MAELMPWLEPWYRRFVAAMAAERAPQALMLGGPRGVGKEALAQALAARWLCERPLEAGESACGQCRSCRLLRAGDHPLAWRLAPEASLGNEGRQITLEQIRDLQEGLSLAEAGRRVVTIVPAEAMNRFTANALLKVLEEPPAGVSFLLVTESPSALLPTVRSRCQVWWIAPPARDAALAWLATQEGGPQAAPLLDLAGGAPLAALQWARAGWGRWIERFLAEVGGEAPKSPLTWAAGLESWLKAKETQESGFGLEAWMDWWLRWLHDLARVASGAPARHFPQAGERLRALAGRASLRTWLALETKARARAEWVRHPLNLRLYLEDVVSDYADLIGGKG